MAIYRHIQTDIWKDEKVLEDMTPEDKLFLMYLLTNSNTTQIGIYKLSKKQTAFELGYSEESVKVFIDRFENQYDIIKYNNDTREVVIKNWGKYNLNKGGKPIIDCIRKELVNVKDKSLIKVVYDSILKDDIKKEFGKFVDRNTDTNDDISIDNTMNNNVKNRNDNVKNSDDYSISSSEDTLSDFSDDTLCDFSDVKIYNMKNSNVNNDIYDTYNESLTISIQKEKEKEKQKQKEKENINKDESVEVGMYDYNLKKFKSLFEENIGLINGITSQWLIEVSEEFEYELFKKALEIATNKGKCNKGYVNGILNQWRDINIKSIDDFDAYMVSVKNHNLSKGNLKNFSKSNGGIGYGMYEFGEKDSKFKYASSCEGKNDKNFNKPTDEELEKFRREYNLS